MSETKIRHQPHQSMDKPIGPSLRTHAKGLAADVSRIVAENLREARRRRGLSLDGLAALSGVSRAMLGQIETAKSVPTITLIWKVAKALDIPVAELISEPSEAPWRIIRGDRRIGTEDRGVAIASRVVAALRLTGTLEVHELVVPPGRFDAPSTLVRGSELMMIILTGTVDITIAGQETEHLVARDAVLIRASREFCLCNSTTEPTVLMLAVTS